jgi:ABC-type uncharacterized transport system substrate-binding protein
MSELDQNRKSSMRAELVRLRRREFLGVLGGAAIAWPLVVHAQQASKVWRIGYLGFGTAAAFADRAEALRAGLLDLGYIEGKNIVIEFRWGETVEQLQKAAAELVRMNVDVIFATSSAETEHAKQATNTIPIVFATHADPVGLGHVPAATSRDYRCSSPRPPPSSWRY